MKEVYLSTCKKNFIQKIISEGHRLDGRDFNESRRLEIKIGSEYGSVIVSLGETKVLAQVSCEVVQPKQIRPNEGILYINVEVGPMAAPQFEAGRQADLAVYLNRLLEKCYKDSKCVDLESLCIVVEEKVWSLRVDVKVLNHAGNLTECASLATLTALAHFKRPDVTRVGESVIIHTLVEKDPIPTVLYHYPVCLTFAIFGNDILISDPSATEEAVCAGSTEQGVATGGALLAVAVNQYRELCLLQLTGAALSGAAPLQRALRLAADRARDLVDTVKRVIVADDTMRQKRLKVTFADAITSQHVLSLARREPAVRLRAFTRPHPDDEPPPPSSPQPMDEDGNDDDTKYSVVAKKAKSAEIVASGSASKWIEISSDSDDS